MDPITISSILSDLTSIVTGVSGQLGTWITAIVSNPLILMFTLIPLVGIGIGLIKRLVNVN